MGNWSSIPWLTSQILEIVVSILIGASFFIKKRIPLLSITILSSMLLIVIYGLLDAWVGVGLVIIEIARDAVSYFSDKRRTNKNRYKITRFDTIMLCVWVVAIFLITFLTEEGILSIFAILGTLLFTIGIWQKNHITFLVLGAASEGFWIVYNVYIQNLVGLLTEIILFITSIIGLILYLQQRYGKGSQSYLRFLSRGAMTLPNSNSYVINDKLTNTDLDNIIELDRKVYKKKRLIKKEKIKSWITKNPYIYTVLRSKDNNIVGYINFMPLTPSAWQSVYAKQIVDKEIDSINVETYQENQSYNGYLTSFVIDPKENNSDATKILLESFCEKIYKLQRQGIKIHRVLVDDISEDGNMFFDNLGFRSLGKTGTGSDLKEGTMQQILTCMMKFSYEND